MQLNTYASNNNSQQYYSITQSRATEPPKEATLTFRLAKNQNPYP
jgi:hypothetical protein